MLDIKPKNVTVGDIVSGFAPTSNDGVRGFDGDLNIRPDFQREIVYHESEMKLVVDSMLKKYPIGPMYWMDLGGGKYDLLDGQQRTLSFCFFIVDHRFDVNGFRFNPDKEEHKELLNYPLDIHVCKGTKEERSDWFERINTVGDNLTKQEIRNAVYACPWVTDAKRFFSKDAPNAKRGHLLGKHIMTGKPERQAYLESMLIWECKSKEEKKIRDYMDQRQHDEDAEPLKDKFQDILKWVSSTFVGDNKANLRIKEMKPVSWGVLYDDHSSDLSINPSKIQAEVTELFSVIDTNTVTKPSGIYPYVLTRDEKHLNIRSFKDSDKRKAYEQQGRKCFITGKEAGIEEMEADHHIPWNKGGKTDLDNLRMVLREENRRKGG